MKQTKRKAKKCRTDGLGKKDRITVFEVRHGGNYKFSQTYMLCMERSNYTSGSQTYIVLSKAVVHITLIIWTGQYDITLTSAIDQT